MTIDERPGKLDTLGLASLILGLVTFMTVWCCIGYPVGIVAIVLGAVALSRNRSDGYSATSRILAFSGIGISIGAIMLHVVLMAIGQVAKPDLPVSRVDEVSVAPPAPAAPPSAPAPAAPQAAPAPVVEAPLTESCADLAGRFGTSSKLSDLQKEELWKQYADRTFAWKLRVTEVSSDFLGGFTVQYKCAPKSSSFIQDIQIKYPETRKSFVMQLEKDSVYNVQGRLRMSSTLLGMTADDLP
ncbi:MAG: DUF4190 domain-containing protein [Pseudomonadota bacterium]|nr:DUF4190 domain-containing protein [Pseudomonadota bacterium]